MADARPETTGRKPQELSSGERLLPPSDAANLLRLSTSWLAKARMRGDGPPYVKLGRVRSLSRERSGPVAQIADAAVNERAVTTEAMHQSSVKSSGE